MLLEAIAGRSENTQLYRDAVKNNVSRKPVDTVNSCSDEERQRFAEGIKLPYLCIMYHSLVHV